MDSVDISSLLGDQARSAGSTPRRTIDLVRNPNYKQGTGQRRARTTPTRSGSRSTRARPTSTTRSRPGSSTRGELAASRRRCCEKYATDPSLKPYLHVNAGDRTWYLTMNLTQPPFDDIHVRTRDELDHGQGGPAPGVGRPDHRRRSRTTSSRTRCSTSSCRSTSRTRPPAITAASRRRRLAMKGSKYDTNGDGMCSAQACKNVLLIADTRAVDPGIVRVIEAGRGEDRHHVHRAHDQRRVPDDPDAVEERPDRRAPGLGQGLRRRADVLHPALRRSHDHPDGQHELLARRDHAVAVQEAQGHGNCNERAERQQRSSTSARR